jgi:hypothetical protein
MGIESSSLGRDMVGFAIGAIAAAAASGLVFVSFIQVPPEDLPRDYTRTVLGAVVVVSFFAGGFIGRRGFSADTLMDLVPPIFGTYAASTFFCMAAGLSWNETLSPLAFVSVGIFASALLSVALQKFFPLELPVETSWDDPPN